MKGIILLAFALAGCGDNLSSEEIDIAKRACLNAGMIPHVRYSPQTNQITRVTCEPI